MNSDLSEKLKNLPNSAGVYFHKNRAGQVIYIGKAAVLKNRVRQYFQSRQNMDKKTLALVSEIADVDWIKTDTEIDALFLESEMIKRYKPKWNILLRDDKAATYVRLNMKDDWPFVSYTRQPLGDGAQYIGPFYSAQNLKQALRLLRRAFPFYTKQPVARNSSQLSRQIGLEPAAGISSADYKKSLRQLISYLKGNRVKVMDDLEKDMRAAAERRDFERAANLRNQLFYLNQLKQQVVFSRQEFVDASRDQGLKELQELLNLPEIPRRIEAYDVSHHSGQNSAASMVVMTNGVADKANYRKFLLRISRNNDTAQLRETLQRRLKHLSDWGRPDLIILDGGKGQLSAVADLLNPEKIPFLGRNKSGDHSRNSAVVIILPTEKGFQTHQLASDSHAAKLIARLDDEAHRFAINYHSHLKRRDMLK
ncbi:MAG: GIY-YIG nuclease family protein [Candidatus Nomurabacteria bacterium]|jgi:excinuclease ABC subunit C|nr:GIY-YIG nuclease family protein [Candidatus Nomurabacteria bacterium]